MSELWQEIEAERRRQDAIWGGPEHDDTHSPEDWVAYIDKHADKGVEGEGIGTFRQRMIEVAALAIAAIEATDRMNARDRARDEPVGEPRP